LSFSQSFLNKIATENTYASLIFKDGWISSLTINPFLQVTIQVFFLERRLLGEVVEKGENIPTRGPCRPSGLLKGYYSRNLNHL